MRRENIAIRRSSVVWQTLHVELARIGRINGVRQPKVVDVGGGTGTWAVPLAQAGCAVTVVEPSPDSLAMLRRRAAEAGVSGDITVVADDSDALGTVVEHGSADVVLAHGLLEVVDDPATVVRALASVVAGHGVVSVLAANRYAAVLHRALAGKFEAATHLLASDDGVTTDPNESLVRRFDAGELRSLLTAHGLTVSLLQGDGVAAESAPDAPDEQLAEFETLAATTPPLRDIATRLHLLAHPVR